METDFTTTDFEATLAALGPSPQDDGIVDMIVSRPAPGERIVLETGELDEVNGLIGDNWNARRVINVNCQITLMNSRIIAAIAGDRAHWPPAGDQLFVDFDLTPDNLPVGQRIAVGSAILEVSATPHTGCELFTERYGHDAIRFVNSPEGRQLRRRGINARVIQSGTVRAGDAIRKLT